MTMAEPTLIYSSNEHGISLTTFYHRSEQYEPTILVIKTTTDDVSYYKTENYSVFNRQPRPRCLEHWKVTRLQHYNIITFNNVMTYECYDFHECYDFNECHAFTRWWRKTIDSRSKINFTTNQSDDGNFRKRDTKKEEEKKKLEKIS